jgi:superfamily II DNA or RNA helicase
MKKFRFIFEFVFDEFDGCFLVITAFCDDIIVNLALSEILTFLYKYERELDKDDSEFCYLLAKYVKKIQIGNNFYLAVPREEDIAYIFRKMREFNVEAVYESEQVNKRLEFDKTLPLAIKFNKAKNYVVCNLDLENNALLDKNNLMLFEDDISTIYFSKGNTYEVKSKKLADFLDQFHNNEKIYLDNEQVVDFYKEIYTPNAKVLNWDNIAILQDFLPKEKLPVPALSIDYKDKVLEIKISFNYEGYNIKPENKIGLIQDKNGNAYVRQIGFEQECQHKLMQLFEENNLPFLLVSPKDIADFISKVVPVLNDIGWEVNSNVPDFNIISEPQKLTFSVSSTQNDWFYFEPNCDVAGQNMSCQEIARLLVENTGYLKTKNGFVKIQKESYKELEMLSKMGAFKVGQKYSKKDILPLVSLSQVQGKNSSSKNLVKDVKDFYKKPFEVGKSFQGTLRDYQIYGVNWLNLLYSMGLGGILADDMGLGKTVQIIALTSINTDKPCLIVCPTNVVYNWEKEIKKFRTNSKTLLYVGQDRQNKLSDFESNDFIITTYGVIKNDVDVFLNFNFPLLVLDEAQYIKNSNTQASKAIKLLKADFKIAMTGTPIENYLSDLWNIFDFLQQDYLGTQASFERAITADKELIKNRIKPFILRRMKKEVLTSLPDKVEIIKKCKLAPEQETLYKTVLAAAKQGVRDSNGKLNRLHVLTSILKLRQVCTLPSLIKELAMNNAPSTKLDTAKEMIEELISENHKIVLFSQFTGVLDNLVEFCTELDIYFERIDGQVTGKKRIEAIDRFQESSKPGVFLISLKAGGIGINLTAADYVLHLDPWWNPAIEAQATDRVHRFGQKNKVIVYKLITEGTIEEKIYDLQEQKKTLLGEIIDIDSVSEKKIDIKELQGFFI